MDVSIGRYDVRWLLLTRGAWMVLWLMGRMISTKPPAVLLITIAAIRRHFTTITVVLDDLIAGLVVSEGALLTLIIFTIVILVFTGAARR